VPFDPVPLSLDVKRWVRDRKIVTPVAGWGAGRLYDTGRFDDIRTFYCPSYEGGVANLTLENYDGKWDLAAPGGGWATTNYQYLPYIADSADRNNLREVYNRLSDLEPTTVMAVDAMYGPPSYRNRSHSASRPVWNAVYPDGHVLAVGNPELAERVEAQSTGLTMASWNQHRPIIELLEE